jgi:hypothetical protein
MSFPTCNRKVCNSTARMWNTSTRAYYCTPCARRINDENGLEICHLHFPCDGCNKLYAMHNLKTFDFIPSDKIHLGVSESESADLCKDCCGTV